MEREGCSTNWTQIAALNWQEEDCLIWHIFILNANDAKNDEHQ